MKSITRWGLVLGVWLLGTLTGTAQSQWPKEIPLDNGGKVILYQPQPEQLNGNVLDARSAVSVRQTAGDEPIFGAIWTRSTLLTDKDERMATLESVRVTDAKFPNMTDADQVRALRQLLEREIPRWHLEISLDEVVATLDQEHKGTKDDFRNEPPHIIYTREPTTLVLLDGEPVLKQDAELGMERVNNSPFMIVRNPDDNQYYLYGGKFWYQSSGIKNGWTPVGSLPARIRQLDAQLKQNNEDTSGGNQASGQSNDLGSPPAILVSTKPAELIQSRGEADFASVQGTSLLYMSNSDNEIFMDINSQQYYVLLSGRWYRSGSLDGPWSYTGADQLPPDFARIPEGSEKDAVLVNVAGTKAAKDALLDAQIPQTAKVDRRTATCNVTYDGEPNFEPVSGTSMRLAANTSSTVLMAGNQYYCVENGVWFVSDYPTGPWVVSTVRPMDVDRIPPSSPAYNTRYVYIYETTPEYVYVGYTPGYLGCYAYGPTVVYGTGYYYRPWHRVHYYPRPVTWGFGMHYNPWSGWSMHFGYSSGWFSFGAVSRPNYGGWWGPPVYRPPYRPPYWGHYYGRNVTINQNVNINVNRTTNVYNYRRDVITRDVYRRPEQWNNGGYREREWNRTENRQAGPGYEQFPRENRRPEPERARDMPNNLYSDRSGNVYQRDNGGNWQQREGREWKEVNRERQPDFEQMEKHQEMRDRGFERMNNFQQVRPREEHPEREMRRENPEREMRREEPGREMRREPGRRRER